jgi:DNA (cytosine-5)-methyltransferase 1
MIDLPNLRDYQTDPITFGSLFAGIGGIDLGFERAGMVGKWQVEIDDYATRVLTKHWPNVHRERDIRECGAHNLEQVDVIAGGFPCQDISYAGRGAGLDGERSGLFFEAVRLVRELQPRVVVLENVAALLTRGLDRVLGTLAEIGYDAEWHCIPAASVGAPHIRDRVFVIGLRGRNSDCIDDDSQQERNQQNSIASGISCWCDERESADMANSNSKGLEGRPQNDSRANREQANAKWAWLPVERHGWWTVEPDVGRVANGIPARVDRFRGLGNAVVPQVAEYIGRHIVEALK